MKFHFLNFVHIDVNVFQHLIDVTDAILIVFCNIFLVAIKIIAYNRRGPFQCGLRRAASEASCAKIDVS